MKLLVRAAWILFAGVLAAASRPTFDVASVKANNSGTGVDRIRKENGSLIIDNVSLKRLIGMAYGVPEGQDYLYSGPEWLDSENFDIWAKFPVDTPEPNVMLMLQGLLEERFKLALHHETREFSVLALVAGKKGAGSGLNLHVAAAPDGPYKFKFLAGHATGSSISMAMLATRLSRPDLGLDRRVVDFTGLTGTFDLTLDWNPEDSIFSAIAEQLGLRLEPRKVSLDVLVVDHVDKTPSGN